jgi:hypothetical protein
MKISTLLVAAISLLVPGFPARAAVADRQIPEPLKTWQDWATWDDTQRDCPTPYNSAEKRMCFWPSMLSINADAKGGSWQLGVTVFEKTWLPLPGNAELWPMNVSANEKPLVVVEHEGAPGVQLEKGNYAVAGEFRWEEMPQRIEIPKQVGLLALTLDAKKVDIPNWDENGTLWLKRARQEAAEKDLLAVQVYRLFVDGIPLWLQTEIELSVSGKSREEELGWLLPEGWKLSTINSPIPVAVDDNGRIKAQVRAGKWRIRADAFRASDLREVKFAAGASPVAKTELIGFRASPEFRLAEIEGMQAVDVTQTTFPEHWRNFPVYSWDVAMPFRLVEKMRGMGSQRPEGLNIRRQFWLDEDGRGLTYSDSITAQAQQIWRLDVAEGAQLGAVRIDGTGQLITADPKSGAPGVEVRTRNLNLEAIGRLGGVKKIPATGWRADANSLDITINLPPGWRLFSLFGADRVWGDWLTSWTLLGLFLLLFFTLAVFRLWGFFTGLVAFVAFALAYHEPGAPRYAWFFLLIPLALLRMTSGERARKWISAWKYLAAGVLVLILVPFVAGQLQNVIYPQLEPQGASYRRGALHRLAATSSLSVLEPSDLPGSYRGGEADRKLQQQEAVQAQSANLMYEAKAKIQTGPALPGWTWNTVRCSWNGPVSAKEEIRPVFISLRMHRVLTVVRLAFVVLLAAMLLRVRAAGVPSAKSTATAAVLLLALCLPTRSSAQLPDKETLGTLRERLLEPSDAYPNAAEIPSVDLKLSDGAISMVAEIHAATRVAVPVPGRLPAWSPVSVTMDGAPAASLRREDGYLWVVVPEGVHRVAVQGMLPEATEWAWSFLLKPRRVVIDAPGWSVTGVRPGGVPEQQVFFARQRKAAEGEAAYDRKDFNAIVVVDRHLEVGLNWQVRSEVKRLSSAGRAVSLKVPLLEGEKVLTSNMMVENGAIEVRLGAGEESFAWESELPVGAKIALTAEKTDRWVERWHLVTSPVWNVSHTGLAPVFQPNEQNLIPVWHPWPGESAALEFSKPAALSGETITVRRVTHAVSLGARQATSQLDLDIECSLGADFPIALDPQAEISGLSHDGRAIPVRRDGGRLIVTVHPGTQPVQVQWRSNIPLRSRASVGAVKLPVEAANITTTIGVPESRWVLWANGPLRGPAVRFWSVLAVAVVAAWVLGGLSMSPLRRYEWLLLALGLTQVHFGAALVVVGWFFAMAGRGRRGMGNLPPGQFKLLQIGLALLTVVALGVLLGAVGEGLLGNPKMFIRGNGSTNTMLKWFQPRGTPDLPEPHILSVSVWYYRLLMLAWALWLASSLIRWLKWAWDQFGSEGFWKTVPKKTKTPAVSPPASM